MKPKLRIVQPEETERMFGSAAFIRLSRNPALDSPKRFEPTVKREGDIIL